ncbi:hypothetical protein [Streptomyces galbus]|uniref:Mycothiol-dependent maleylpyruvate isomerase metal-binding domain-containing protein n=1 Tax=Streptomyces galbus TaxID=33898 RepID=A0A4U5X1B7_STRGB|nr:hypothetical protein [Streptomyces galbus]TKT08142.1 hypothetical protein E4U92_19320 [Streptomyces galbus]GHD43037.1 hypothetical protein GCM10010335_46580 [Streptomyces galbus]
MASARRAGVVRHVVEDVIGAHLATLVRHLADSDLPRDAARAHWAALPASYEFALHAWDINQTTGCRTPLPPTLVEALLAHAPLVVDGVDRTDLFAPPLSPPRPGHPTDRLLALFGRRALPAARHPKPTGRSTPL